METFKMDYKGVEIAVTKFDDGRYVAALPTRHTDKGNEIRSEIRRVDGAWMFSSYEPKNPEYYFNVWLRDDGSMDAANDIGKINSKKMFDPDMPRGDDIVNDICQDIVDVVKKVAEHERLGIPMENVVALRKKYLESCLELLGYSSTDRVKKGEIDIKKCCMGLGKVAGRLEEYINLGAYVFQRKPGDYGMDIPSDMSKEQAKELILKVAEQTKANLERITTERELNDTKREVVPNFGLTMKEDLPPEEWENYINQCQNVARLLLELNYDIVPGMDRVGLTDLSELTGLDLHDRISRVIDTKAFSVACNSEDRYVRDQNDKFSETIDYLVDDSERVINSSPGAALRFLKEQAVASRREREEYIKKYDEIEKLYYSKIKKQEEKPIEEEGREGYGD